jgi:hypothetical protein
LWRILTKAFLTIVGLSTMYFVFVSRGRAPVGIKGSTYATISLRRNAPIDIGTVYTDSRFTTEVRILNDLSTDVRILSVRSSCGCMFAAINNKYLNVGECGTLKILINFGSQPRLFASSVILETDKSAPTVMPFVASISDAIDVQPRILVWHTGENGQSKEVHIRSRIGQIVTLKNIHVSDANFVVKQLDTCGGDTLIIRITPCKLQIPIRTNVTWDTVLSDERIIEGKVYAFIE